MISMFAMLPVTGVKIKFLTAVIFSVLGLAMPGLMSLSFCGIGSQVIILV